LLNTILKNYPSDVRVSVYYNVNGENARLRQFVLIMNQLDFGATGKGFFEIMDNWYSDKDFERWKKNYMVPYNSDQKFEDRLVEHNHWFSLHHFNFTPFLFINGYKYPKEYQLNEII